MNGIIATFRIKPDQTDAFEARFGQLAAEVKAQEPGAKLYQLAKSKTEPGVYKVMEIYADDDAQRLHMNTPYFKTAIEDLKPMTSAPLDIYEVSTLD